MGFWGWVWSTSSGVQGTPLDYGGFWHGSIKLTDGGEAKEFLFTISPVGEGLHVCFTSHFLVREHRQPFEDACVTFNDFVL
eukprot:85313-Amphidinium_carterae.1